MRKAIRSLLASLRFNLSRFGSPVFVAYYRHLYRTEPGTLAALISAYSRHVGSGFTVIQVGANDGISHDPIHKFIKRDNWGGVLLEPQKQVFDDRLSKLYERHDDLHVLNAALGPGDGTTTLFEIGFSEARWATGLATFDRSILEKAFDSGYVARRCAKEGTSLPEDAVDHIVEETVDVISPSTLLERFGVEHIDLLMIDTEGFDCEIIKMFDIAATRPGMIIFEHVHLPERAYDECLDLLRRNDYVVHRFGPNTAATLDVAALSSRGSRTHRNAD